MANRTLAGLGMVVAELLIRERQQREQQIDAGVLVDLNRYYLRFDELEKQEGEATLYRLCQELANCFRGAESADQKADVAPILRNYLSSDINNLASVSGQ